MADIGALLSPNAVAVIGAAPDDSILRGRILHVMMQHPFAGAVYPVSRSFDEVQGLKAYPSIEALPERVDLAIMIIPAKFVPDELERCGKAGVKAVQILTSGFAEEVGEDGAKAQQRLRDIAERYDMAVVGPNSEGFASTKVALCPTFSPTFHNQTRPMVPAWRKTGHLAAVAQSGGIGFAFYDRGRPKELPFSYVATTGNEAVINCFDIIEHIIDKDDTDAFLIFMEDVKNPETFRRVAEKAMRAGKPLIVTKVGKSAAGERAAASHTAALSGSYSTYQAMFRRYGIIEGADTDEMVEMAMGFSLFGHCLPKGKRVGIVTGSGGGGGWMADTLSMTGLEVPTLDAETRAVIDALIPAYGTSQNPVDGTAGAVREIGYANLLGMVRDSPSVDAIVGITSARRASTYEDERENLSKLARETEKPILIWSYTNPHEESVTSLSQIGLPLFTNSRNCARTLYEMAEYRAFRERFLRAPEIKSGANADQAIVGKALDAANEVLCEYEARPLLAAYGIGDGGARMANSAQEAADIAADIAAPVALKVQSPDILHKSEAGAVALNLKSADDVRAAYDRIMASAQAYNAGANIHGVLVQAMAPAGQEMILGVNQDEKFGPILMVGLGGIYVEVLKDVAFSPVPFGADDARRLLDRLKGVALLHGVRGEAPSDVDALVDLMVGLSEFAADFGDKISEIDLNPVLVHPEGQGVSVADALIVKSSKA
ncbi:MAG: acetate--CoA ligase family protein [Rhodospirillaceae bacterium]|jgi:acetate---CoA ligase (ADP-forming)|nr:acetate--CoA ligase family protein [Rhodospirillaceae bacterium]MBT5666864.1 acetate--CoA ligase family protein [Rhodospirillaceae bacterium]MBT5808897.1 acetate--CoA ligase family protein [Rhodospirillaceae bacterium]